LSFTDLSPLIALIRGVAALDVSSLPNHPFRFPAIITAEAVKMITQEVALEILKVKPA
jgi:hypothetical protein